jgi:aspartyl-tRNA(Asn)/glutamyl-tRNA(Gln) amidotransferase subunit C
MLASGGMAHITREDVLQVAALAQLQLDEQDVARVAAQLARILEYADMVQQVDTSGVEPTAGAGVPGRHWREDLPAPSLPRDAALAPAPDADRDAGLFRVPRVL